MIKRATALSFLMVCFLAFTSVNAEQTVGLFVYDSTAAYEGYTLLVPKYSNVTYLIDNSGRVVHTWNSNYRPGVFGYLRENGNLVRAGSMGCIYVGGGAGIVQEYEWDGALIWEFEYCNEQYVQHHDIEPLPNGNVLLVAKEWKSDTAAIAAGRDPRLLNEPYLWPGFIAEVQPVGTDSGIIVWEWHVWDHLIQDYDSTKENYGVVEDHPELMDINYSAQGGSYLGIPDWNHFNSVDYNEVLDQIIISLRNQCEVWVVDHSTTTEEAAGHTGGNSGKGGDLLYRWGNPASYRAAPYSERQLFYQHDAQWIKPGYPGEGNILIFNNGEQRPGGHASSVDEIVPPVDSMGNYYLEPDSAYGPEEPIWTYMDEIPTSFYAHHISGCQRQPNGNTLICDGPMGNFFEVSPDTEIVWQYINPVLASGPMMQGDTIPPGWYGLANQVFKIRRYAPDFPGFQGHQLIPGDPIETYPDNINDLVIDYEINTVTLNWTPIFNPLVIYYIYLSDDPGSTFSQVDTISDTIWSTVEALDRRFYRVTFEVAPYSPNPSEFILK